MLRKAIGKKDITRERILATTSAMGLPKRRRLSSDRILERAELRVFITKGMNELFIFCQS